ncbi:MAG TPA: M48 family metallopeptidase, partial [Nitrospirae bacterium]|nr:M48 family metallopeptidase [Nitrospirota bacterium]
MRYRAKELKQNVNVSRTSPIKELFILLGGVLGILIAVYAALGFAVDLVVPKLPSSIEQSLGRLYSGIYDDTDETPAEAQLQKILDRLSAASGDTEIKYKVHIVLNPQANALALPGGNIIVFSRLIEETASENELAFVLAHELGHFANRDHLRGLGRGLVLLTISAALLGADSSATNFIMNSLQNVEMKFSQRQEQAADLWALDLLNKTYGHVGGATDFFEHMSKNDKRGRIRYYFATHPHPENRIRVLRKNILKKAYLEKEKTALD